MVTLSMTKEQAETLKMACEVMARLYVGQTNMLNRVCNADRDTLNKVKELCFPELVGPSYHAITNQNVSDDAKQLWDFYQVIRHYLSWEDQPNTPKTRDWKTQMTVNFDEPMKISETQALPIIKGDDNESNQE